MTQTKSDEFDYIVVGSGAGGAPLAARLAEDGRYTVLVIEAGGDPRQTQPSRDTYDVPAFHPLASEDQRFSWRFFVRHYSDERQQAEDDKYFPEQGGVFYPREAALGGCTAHNAMIFVRPAAEDWNHIADSTGDVSWRAEKMERYFRRVENCHHRGWFYRFLGTMGINPTGHGWNGWLETETALPETALQDENLVRTVLASIGNALSDQPISDIYRLLSSKGDPNDLGQNPDGLRYIPFSTRNHQRVSARERLLDVAMRFPQRLKIEQNALVTRVLFGAGNQAIGVEYLKGERLYRASASPSQLPGELRQVRARREVILCGGAFNTPQLLMLSGIGPANELQEQGITVRIDLPGVGKNLQDRYEVGVVHRMKDNWRVFDGATFSNGDQHYKQWESERKGIYTSNGAIGAVIRGNLFSFLLLSYFKGYFPGYSKLVKLPNYLTWSILRAHTNNRAGRVTLRSADAQDMPDVNFHYFQEGTDTAGGDLESVVDGIENVRRLMSDLKRDGLIEEEVLPGASVKSRQELERWVRANAWGHHASCSCPIGPQMNGGVLTSNFRVHGTKGLRVVDASAFPRIPGYFIVSAIYTIAEKAAEVILAAR